MPGKLPRSKPRIFCGEVTPDAPAIRELWRRHAEGDAVATARLLEHYAPLAWRSAGRCKRISPDLFIDSIDELASDGLIGIYHALRYATHGDGFIALALRAAKFQIKRSQRQRRGFTVRSDYQKQSIAKRLRADAVTMTGMLPTEQEQSNHVVSLIDNPNIEIERRRPQTLHFSGMSHDDGNAFDVADLHSETPDARAMDRETIKLAMKGLSGSDRAIFSKLLKGFGQAEIAAELGISRQRVHQRLNGVLWEARKRADLARHLGVEPEKVETPQTNRSPIGARKLMRMVG